MLIYYLLAAFLGVSNMVLWGVYGDLLVEKFELKKVLRSFFWAGLYALSIYVFNADLPLFIVALSIIALERASTEIYKAFFRVEDQSKYKIPSDLKIKFPGAIKLLIGVLAIAALFAYLFHVNLFGFDKLLLIFLAGFFTALGGMLKDAPFEGFSLLKFFRSPILAFSSGLVILFIYPYLDPKFFILSIFGAERILSKSYKKIIKGRIPGKFKQNLNINQDWLSNRKYVLLLYALNILSMVLLMTINQ